jgi:hypothetical protein
VRRLVFTLIVLSFVALASAAGATQVVEPSARPYPVPGDAHGNPQAFTIVATGFRPGGPVYVEQCDGVPPTVPQWQPTAHCDLGTSPAPVYADAGGRVTFDAHDPNHRFIPFVGRSPQDLFDCGVPGNCTVRVSSNNSSATIDQVFFAIALPSPKPGAPAGNAHSSTTPTAAAASSDGSGGTASADASGSSATSGSATTAAKGPGALAFTGISAVLTGLALVLLGVGVALLARSRR